MPRGMGVSITRSLYFNDTKNSRTAAFDLRRGMNIREINMKLTVLIENKAVSDLLAAEHGLSVYVETGDRNVLVDFGDSGAFADNAGILGVDISKVDLAFLSTGTMTTVTACPAFSGKTQSPPCTSADTPSANTT